jgi:hypothetical protein
MRAGSVGLSVEAAREVLERRTFREAIDADWELSRQYGITGVRRSWRGATAWWASSPTRRWRRW